MSGKIVILKGSYLYDAVNVFAEETGAGFEELGLKVSFIDLTRQDVLGEAIVREYSEPCVMTLAFGAVGCDFKYRDGLLHDFLPHPFFAFMVDHPAQHIDRFQARNIIISCIDKTHVAFLNEYFAASKRAFLIPHGGSAADTPPVPHDKRTTGILFAGTCPRPGETLKNLLSIGALPEKVLTRAADIVLAGENVTPEHAVDEAARECGIRHRRDTTASSAAVAMLELHIRAVKRMRILETLDNAGVRVDICGRGWDGSAFRSHVVHAEAGFRDTLRLMADSRVVLNIANYPDGSHERVFSGMLNGAAVLGDFNPFWTEIFDGRSDMAFYKWTELGSLPDIARRLLDNSAAVAENGMRKASEAHSWRHRAAQILSVAKSCGRTQQ